MGKSYQILWCSNSMTSQRKIGKIKIQGEKIFPNITQNETTFACVWEICFLMCWRIGNLVKKGIKRAIEKKCADENA